MNSNQIEFTILKLIIKKEIIYTTSWFQKDVQRKQNNIYMSMHIDNVKPQRHSGTHLNTKIADRGGLCNLWPKHMQSFGKTSFLA